MPISKNSLDLVKRFLSEKNIEEINLYEGLRLAEFAEWLEAAQLRVNSDSARRCPKCGGWDGDHLVCCSGE